MKRTKADHSLTEKIEKLQRVKQQWENAVSLLERKLNLSPQTSPEIQRRIRANPTPKLARDLASLLAGHHQIGVVTQAIENLQYERKSLSCQTTTDTAPAATTSLNS